MSDFTTLMKARKRFETINAATQHEWQNWLRHNRNRQGSVWLIAYKQGAGVESVQYADLNDEVLCFGLIESIVADQSNRQFYLYFLPTTSQVNVQRERGRARVNSAGYSDINVQSETIPSA